MTGRTIHGISPSATASLADAEAETHAVLDAAMGEFLAKGYEGANLRSIVAASGRSTGDVYRRFGSKENLFRAVVERHVDLSLPRSMRLAVSPRPAEQELAEFALAYLTDFFDPATLALSRLVIKNATVVPDLARRLWEIGPQLAIDQVDHYLATLCDQGRADIANCRLAAAQFIEMVKAGLYLRFTLVGTVPTPDDLRNSACQAAAIFARGIGAA